MVVGLYVAHGKAQSAPLAARPTTASAKVLSASDATLTAPDSVEVPDLVGVSVKEAQIVLSSVGLIADVESSSAVDPASKVTSQSPEASAIVHSGDTILLGAAAESTRAAQSKKARKFVVCIDPGHQQHSDNKMEAIGPGSKTTKSRVSAGTTGVSTHLPEYEVALQISMNIRERLEKAGIKVVMTRTTNDVSLSNADRARIANKAHADLFLRIHCDGSPEPKVSGISTLYPGRNKWTAGIASPSKRAARLVQDQVVASTQAINLGLHARKDLAGFNHVRRPSVLVECGFMSNRVEDRLLASPHYQDSISEGISAGVLAYLRQTGE